MDQAKAGTTASGFARWSEFFLREANDSRPEFWYLAQVAYEVYLLRATWGGVPVGSKPKGLKDFLLTFTAQGGVKEKTPGSGGAEPEGPPAEVSQAQSKSFWKALVGLGRRGLVGRKQPRP